jgi:hypothetical protein
MPSSGDIVALIGTIGAVSIAYYAAYWAFIIRRGLSIGLYRDQALGIGLVALSYFTFIVYTEIGFPFATNGYPGTWLLTIFPPVAFLFYWVDTSARAARRADPLLRDSLHWSKVRSFVWPQVLAFMISYAFAAAYNLVFGMPEFEAILITLVGLAAVFEMLVVGAAVLLVAAIRSGDKALRRHLGWFGFFILFAAVGAIVAAATFPFHHVGLGLISYVVSPPAAFVLYRSARSLAPLNRIETSGLNELASLDPGRSMSRLTSPSPR